MALVPSNRLKRQGFCRFWQFNWTSYRAVIYPATTATALVIKRIIYSFFGRNPVFRMGIRLSHIQILYTCSTIKVFVNFQDTFARRHYRFMCGAARKAKREKDWRRQVNPFKTNIFYRSLAVKDTSDSFNNDSHALLVNITKSVFGKYFDIKTVLIRHIYSEIARFIGARKDTFLNTRDNYNEGFFACGDQPKLLSINRYSFLNKFKNYYKPSSIFNSFVLQAPRRYLVQTTLVLDRKLMKTEISKIEFDKLPKPLLYTHTLVDLLGIAENTLRKVLGLREINVIGVGAERASISARFLAFAAAHSIKLKGRPTNRRNRVNIKLFRFILSYVRTIPGAKGIRILVSGRINRRGRAMWKWFGHGPMPWNDTGALIDTGIACLRTKNGVITVKVGLFFIRLPSSEVNRSFRYSKFFVRGKSLDRATTIDSPSGVCTRIASILGRKGQKGFRLLVPNHYSNLKVGSLAAIGFRQRQFKKLRKGIIKSAVEYRIF